MKIYMVVLFVLMATFINTPNADAQTQIVEPDTLVSSSPSSAIWLVTYPTSQGVDVKLAAVEYDWLPNEGLITAIRLDGASSGAGRIFRNGFEAGVTLVDNGVITSTWWTPRTGPGPSGWETDRVFATLSSAGTYKIRVYYDNGASGAQYTDASFTVNIP